MYLYLFVQFKILRKAMKAIGFTIVYFYFSENTFGIVKLLRKFHIASLSIE